MSQGYAPEKIEYGINRYQNETRRLYGVMNTQLGKTNAYLVGDKITIADLSSWGWVAGHRKSSLIPHALAERAMLTRDSAKDWAGINIDDFPHLKAWLERVLARPASEKGRHVPSRHTALEQKNLSQEELDKKAEQARAWVQQGMAADAKK